MRHTLARALKWRHLRPIALACFTLPLLAACGGGGGMGSGSSTLNLGITDGPIDSATSVVISITGVELQPSGGGKAVTVNFKTPTSVDLMQDTNGKATGLLSGESVPAGNYQWIRLLVNVASDGTVANSYIDINGGQYPLRIPSGAQTGLKLVQGFTLSANQTANYTIDFMLAQSISATAPPGQTTPTGQQVYFLVPAMRLVNNTQVGTLSGTVALSSLQTAAATTAGCLTNYTVNTAGPLPDAHIYIFSGSNATLTDIQNPPPSGYTNPVVASITYSSSTNSYTYDQPFLDAGPYTVAIACGTDDPLASDPSDLTFLGQTGTLIGIGGSTNLPTGVQTSVTANQTTTLDF